MVLWMLLMIECGIQNLSSQWMSASMLCSACAMEVIAWLCIREVAPTLHLEAAKSISMLVVCCGKPMCLRWVSSCLVRELLGVSVIDASAAASVLEMVLGGCGIVQCVLRLVLRRCCTC